MIAGLFNLTSAILLCSFLYEESTYPFLLLLTSNVVGHCSNERCVPMRTPIGIGVCRHMYYFVLVRTSETAQIGDIRCSRP